MQYTKFFAGVLRNHGSLNFNPDQMRLIMNLIHLEGKREGIISIQSRFEGVDPPNRYDLIIKSFTDQIEELTNGLSPSELFQKWQQSFV